MTSSLRNFIGTIPFEIPMSWQWVRVQEVASYITDYVANGSFATLKANTKTYKEPKILIKK